MPDTDPAGTSAAIVAARVAYRASTTAVIAARASQLKQLQTSYDASLAALAGSLAGKPAEAAAVNAIRAKVAATLPPAPQKSNPPQ